MFDTSGKASVSSGYDTTRCIQVFIVFLFLWTVCLVFGVTSTEGCGSGFGIIFAWGGLRIMFSVPTAASFRWWQRFLRIWALGIFNISLSCIGSSRFWFGSGVFPTATPAMLGGQRRIIIVRIFAAASVEQWSVGAVRWIIEKRLRGSRWHSSDRFGTHVVILCAQEMMLVLTIVTYYIMMDLRYDRKIQQIQDTYVKSFFIIHLSRKF